MKTEITNNVTNLIQPTKNSAQSQHLRQENSPKHAITQQHEHTDTVTIANIASQLQRAEKIINATPVVDNQRIEILRSEIKSGNFKIDPTQVANKMMHFESSINFSNSVA